MPGRIDPREFRRTCGRFATGVTVITADTGDRVHGMTANAFVSVSLEPPLILVSVDNRARMRQVIERAGRYGVSILAEDQASLSDHFAGRPVEAAEIRFTQAFGVPLLEGALAHLVARVVEAHPAGDHTLFIGEVEHLAYRDGRPLIFYSGQYSGLADSRGA